MWTRTFWKRTAERAVKTAAEFAGAYLAWLGIADATNPAALERLIPDWQGVAINTLGMALIGAVLAVLVSLASLKIGPADSPSLVE